jgi:REP element-mobilizing transposase RayT
VEYRHGWQLPDPIRALEAHSRMTEGVCLLSPNERRIVEDQVKETCRHRNWTLHAVNCRSNHIHVVVGAADAAPKKIRSDLKSWCTRRLREHCDPKRANWWTERGSERWIFDERSLEVVVHYVLEAQNRKGLDAEY